MSKKRVIVGGRAHNREELLEVCSMGYPFVEISLLDPDAVEKEFDDLLAVKERFSIRYLAHYPNEGNPFDVEGLRKGFVPRIKRLVDLSARLGIDKGTIHFWMDKRWAPPGLVGEKVGLLQDMASHAGGKGVVLCIENLSERYPSFGDAFEAIPSLRMTLDTGHAQLLSRVNTSFEFIRNAFDRIAHIHVHDNNGGKSVKDDLHLPLGKGIIDYPAILNELNNRGYNSTITMEVKPSGMKETEEFLGRYLRVCRPVTKKAPAVLLDE